MSMLSEEIEKAVAWDRFTGRISTGFLIITFPIWAPFWLVGWLVERIVRER